MEDLKRCQSKEVRNNISEAFQAVYGKAVCLNNVDFRLFLIAQDNAPRMYMVSLSHSYLMNWNHGNLVGI